MVNIAHFGQTEARSHANHITREYIELCCFFYLSKKVTKTWTDVLIKNIYTNIAY